MFTAKCDRIWSAGALALWAMLAVASGAWAAVTISGAPTVNMSCVGGVCNATAADAVLNVHYLKSQLASASVMVESGSGAQDIVVAAPLTWTSGVTLTLDAYHSLTIGKPVSVTGTGGLTILTNDGGTGGVFSVGGPGHVTFASLSSPLTINGQAYVLVNSVASLAAGAAGNPYGLFALANGYDASADGTYTGPPVSVGLRGAFDGLGNTISNLKIVTTTYSSYYIGFFSIIGGIVQHFHLSKVTVDASQARYAEGGVGGLAGRLEGNFNEPPQVTKLFEDSVSGTVDGILTPVGGLVGESSGGTVRNCYANVSVSSVSKKTSWVGGLIGSDEQTYVADSYATGSVKDRFGYIGGLIGLNSYGNSMVGVVSSYSTGEVIARAGYVGGLLGSDLSPGSAAFTYWDTTTSGILNLSQGAGSPANDRGITGLTTAQLQAGLPTGFDPTIWGEDPKINGGLPYLQDNPPR